ncbi:MAG: hypothetical protein JRC77_08965, partial [Deltaproteobacteria bacterium]|nr:hypothetical protein [Deltaproteobacteria bacterium]
RSLLIQCVLATVVLVVCGCASLGPSELPALANEPAMEVYNYSYFEEPDPSDLWSAKIAGWQFREHRSGSTTALPAVSGSGQKEPLFPKGDSKANRLRSKYEAYRYEKKREQARELAEWIQEQAQVHYVADGPIDHWATFEETLSNDGDDCDGLELLVFHLLRDLGFREDEVYRAVVYRPSDGQHHMVTLWFEELNDPWVIDPTGAMTEGMPRMSDMPEWVPLKLFTEKGEYSVVAKKVVKPVDPATAEPPVLVQTVSNPQR